MNTNVHYNSGQEPYPAPCLMVFVLSQQEAEAMERFAEAVKLFRAGEVTLPQLEESFLDCLVATFESSGGMGTRQQIRDVCRQSLKDIGSLAELVGGIGNE